MSKDNRYYPDSDLSRRGRNYGYDLDKQMREKFALWKEQGEENERRTAQEILRYQFVQKLKQEMQNYISPERAQQIIDKAIAHPGCWPWVENIDKYITDKEKEQVMAYWEIIPENISFLDALTRVAHGRAEAYFSLQAEAEVMKREGEEFSRYMSGCHEPAIVPALRSTVGGKK